MSEPSRAAQAPTSAAEMFNAGVRAMQQGREDEAADLWTRAWNADRSLVPAARNLIVFHESRNNHARVAELYGDLLADDPYDTDSLIRRASALRHLGRIPDACAHYESAIAVYPYFRPWYGELAELLELGGDPAGAARWRERGEKLDTDAAEMALEDGKRHLKAENFPLAIACLEAVTEELPANLDARMRLAAAYQKAGQVDAALDQYKQALNFTEKAKALVLYKRASLLLKVGKRQEARTDLMLALDHEPNYGRVRSLLRQLSGAAVSGAAAPVGPPAASPAPANAPPPLPAAAAHAPPSSAVPASAAGVLRPAGSRGTIPPTRTTQAPPVRATGRSAPVAGPPQVPPLASVPRPQAQHPSHETSGAEFAEPSSVSGSARPVVQATRLPPPERAKPWDQQLHHILYHALAIPAQSGQAVRVAVLFEPSREFVPAMSHLLGTLQVPAFGLWTSVGSGRIYMAEADLDGGPGSPGVRQEGWLGTPSSPRIDFAAWGSHDGGVAVDNLLALARRAGGLTGFQLVLLLSAGRVRTDQTNTIGAVRNLATSQIVLLRPQYHYADLSLRMQGVSPNWVEIPLPF